MLTSTSDQAVETLEVVRDVVVFAPIDVVFESLLEQLGPLNEGHDRTPIPMKLEPWPGGRWFRDLGNNTGHLWGFVQSIRPNDLLEIHGPLFMSSPAVSHLLYRLSEEGGGTRIRFSHRAVGQIPEDVRDGVAVNMGWTNYFVRLTELVERRQTARH
jgi:hypothetical protein